MPRSHAATERYLDYMHFSVLERRGWMGAGRYHSEKKGREDPTGGGTVEPRLERETEKDGDL